MKLTTIGLLFSLLLNLIAPSPLLAQETEFPDGFDPNQILTNEDIFNVYGMSWDSLTAFLNSKGVLAKKTVTDIDGKTKTAADIIWRVANSYKINPRYLLVLLQKEQSLVEDPTPSQKQMDWATGYAVCDSCRKDDPSIQEFKGFASQLEWAAKQHREKYFIQLLGSGTTIAGKGVGISMEIDGQTIIPKNQATAMLYSYTPHLQGNLNLWKIWNRWFQQKYPNGTILRGTPSEKTYLIQLGQKREFLSPAVLLSMTDPTKVVETPDTDLTMYPDGPPMRYPKYSLLQTETGNIYLIVSNGKRRIENMETFRKFGFMEDDIMEAKEEEILDLPDQDPITQTTIFPQGALLKTEGLSTVWYAENGKKHALSDVVLLKLYFSHRPVKNVPLETLQVLETAEPYQLHEGELIKAATDPTVYVIENRSRRPIASESAFEGMGWKWHNIVTVPDFMIAQYPAGPAIE